MAHAEQRQFFERVRDRFPSSFLGKEVLDIGSLDINGTARDFFVDCAYVGVDVGEGPGVDIVFAGQDLDWDDNTFDVVLSAECFEHNPEWVATFANMVRLSRHLVIMTCATSGRAEHGTHRATPGASPHTVEWDYYRNLAEEDFRAEFDLDSLFGEYEFEVNHQSHDLYFVGVVKE
jgi:SAM-dependent methyltransferase